VRSHPLAEFLAKKSPFDGLSGKMVKVTRDIREEMGERLVERKSKIDKEGEEDI